VSALSKADEAADDLVAIAYTVKTRGLRGEVVADILTDFPERFETQEDVIAVAPNGFRRELKIEGAWFQKNRVILKFAGIDSIESAQELVNHKLCVPESETAQLDTDEFYDWQLVGCAVETVAGEKLGTVREVMRAAGNEILAVAGEKKEYLIPFVEKICVEVDIAGNRIKVDAPEGLLDF
jgi:16S rRNA processing protein RimM